MNKKQYLYSIGYKANLPRKTVEQIHKSFKAQAFGHGFICVLCLGYIYFIILSFILFPTDLRRIDFTTVYLSIGVIGVLYFFGNKLIQNIKNYKKLKKLKY